MNVNVQPQSSTPSLDVLGIEVADLGWEDAKATVYQRIRTRHFTRISFLNAHNSNVAMNDHKVRDVFNDFLILADGVGLDIAAKIIHGRPFPANLNGTDFVPELLSAAPEPLVVGLIGARRENIERAAEALRRIAPLHRYVVVRDGFFSADEMPEVNAALERLRPDILLVAMGVPRQELWMASELDARHCTVAIAVGALLDFLSGAVPRAPAWIRRMRLEWLFRLYIEPGRLWRRYIIGNPLFLARVAVWKLFGRDLHGVK